MSYNSKYTGAQVEELLDQVASGNVGGGGGGITSETDPIFSASPAAGITDEDISSWNNKVDKEDGKQLSTEDFTTLLKQKLDGLSNYDDTAIQASVSKLRTDLDTLVSGDTTTAIKTFNEVIAFLDGLEDTEDLASIIASIERQIAAKQDVITDLETIRDGAAKGATALQEHQDISGKQDQILWRNAQGYTWDTNVRDGYPYRCKIGVSGATYNHFPEVYFSDEDKMSGNFAPFCQANTDCVYIWSKVQGGTIRVDVKLTNGMSSVGVTNALPSGLAKTENLNEYQPVLVSGTNIKTINGTSILGSGNIVISGGSGDSSGGGSGAYAEVSHGTSDTTFTLTPNTFHVWDEVASLDLSFGAETSGVANEYLFQFTSGATATSLTVPDTVEWVDGTPTIEANKTYQVSIVNNIGLIVGV